VTFTVTNTKQADRDFKQIKHKGTRELILDCIDDLAIQPLGQGKPLSGKLAMYRSVRAAKNRYRIIYGVRVIPPENREDPNDEGTVIVTVIGIRKEGDKCDVYELAEQRLG
jgi:mRNA interferase RelE/StbE